VGLSRDTIVSLVDDLNTLFKISHDRSQVTILILTCYKFTLAFGKSEAVCFWKETFGEDQGC
jgi:hypothetical protein